ncbi:hypothetical protein GCM10027589_29290 [Actinocorallia lasiicapitis]
MRFLFRGAAVSGVVAATLLVPTSAARADYQPSDGDFAGCPAPPAGAIRLLWNCVAVNLDKGKVKLGSINQTLSTPMKISIAIGYHEGKIMTITGGLGGGSAAQAVTAAGSPGFEFEVPVVGTINVSIDQAGPMGGTGLIPERIPLKIHLSHWLLGGNCYIGTDADPLVIKPVIARPRVELLNWTPVVRADVSDTTFAVPGASGCGLGVGLMDAIVNSAAGTPSASGNNSITFDAFVRIRNYQLGNLTPTLGMLGNAAPAK